MSRRDRTKIAGFLAACAERRFQHRTAQVDAEGRELCPECGGTDPDCILCDGAGFIKDIGRIDAEDVQR